jgi:hypothetical protein
MPTRREPAGQRKARPVTARIVAQDRVQTVKAPSAGDPVQIRRRHAVQAVKRRAWSRRRTAGGGEVAAQHRMPLYVDAQVAARCWGRCKASARRDLGVPSAGQFPLPPVSRRPRQRLRQEGNADAFAVRPDDSRRSGRQVGRVDDDRIMAGEPGRLGEYLKKRLESDLFDGARPGRAGSERR